MTQQTLTPNESSSKPAPPKKSGPSRRFFLAALFGSWFAVAWTTLSVSLVSLALGTLRFLFPNVLSEPPRKFKVGHLGDYVEGEVSTAFKPRGVWIVRHGGIIYALSTVCTHLGCTPNWLPEEQKFKCPCHGSGFHISGVNFEGPAPRPLERYSIHVDQDGQLVVDMNKKFQKELGQWQNPDSYVHVA